VGQWPDHRVPGRSLTAATATPSVRCNDPAREDRTVRVEPLPDDFKTELVKPAERGQVRAGEGSVKHVEVFQMGSVRTSIFGRPRPLPSHRRADKRYTLNCVEPPIQQRTSYSPSWCGSASVGIRGLETAQEARHEHLGLTESKQMAARKLFHIEP
jgi:hypothetical protein